MKDLKEYPISLAEVMRARSIVSRFIKKKNLCGRFPAQSFPGFGIVGRGC